MTIAESLIDSKVDYMLKAQEKYNQLPEITRIHLEDLLSNYTEKVGAVCTDNLIKAIYKTSADFTPTQIYRAFLDLDRAHLEYIKRNTLKLSEKAIQQLGMEYVIEYALKDVDVLPGLNIDFPDQRAVLFSKVWPQLTADQRKKYLEHNCAIDNRDIPLLYQWLNNNDLTLDEYKFLAYELSNRLSTIRLVYYASPETSKYIRTGIMALMSALTLFTNQKLQAVNGIEGDLAVFEEILTKADLRKELIVFKLRARCIDETFFQELYNMIPKIK